MSQYKFQLNLFSLTDSNGMRCHLENMAQKGWQPVRIGPYIWRYRREEPKNLRYHVAYFPREFMYSPEGAEEKRSYRQACEEKGWQYISGYESLLVFSTGDSSSVPPEMDAAMQLEAINRCFKKRERFLWLYVVALAVLIFGIAFVSYCQDPVEILSNGAWQLGALSVLVCVLLIGFEAIRYARWLKKARYEVNHGRLLPLKSLLSWEIAALILALGFFVGRVWIQDTYARLVSITDLISWVVIFAVAAITRRIKRKENTERKNVFATTVTVVLLVALVMGMAQDFILKNFRPQLEEADMLLSICELTGESSDAVYRSEEMQRSLWLEDLTQYQAINNQNEGAPIMQYRITKIKNPRLTEKCQESCLPARLHDKIPAEDATPWGAEQLWTSHSNGGRTVYYLYYTDRTVTLMVNWELTDIQIEKLANMFQNV